MVDTGEISQVEDIVELGGSWWQVLDDFTEIHKTTDYNKHSLFPMTSFINIA